MSQTPPKFAAQFNDLNRLLLIMKQEATIQHYKAARKTLSNFFALCVAAREALSTGQREVTYSVVQFDEIAAACEDSLLVLLPERLREQLRSRATESASLDGLGVNEPITNAELRLRKLCVLFLESASQPYRGITRLPQWKQLLGEARKEHKAAARAWKLAGKTGDKEQATLAQ